MNKKLIYGIQQVGVGVSNAYEMFEWYGTKLGADVPVFEDNNTATYMAPYMGGQPHEKRAILALNMQGGSGYEIWQYLDREPAKPSFELGVGNLGINQAIIKSKDIIKSFDRLKNSGVDIVSEIKEEPDGKKSFHLKDPCGNLLRIKEFDNWYNYLGKDVGGVFACLLGVSDIDKSMQLYAHILGYDKVVYDKTGVFEDLSDLTDGDCKFRRVLLAHEPNRTGGLSHLFGESQIELIQNLDKTPKKIFADRYWGDIGFIHLCFDIRNMKVLIDECKEKGFPFTVLSSESFDMGDANGHWGYLEDPDGTLIEFVETHKVPIFKPLGLHINFKKRDPNKPAPKWLLKGLQLKKVKKYKK